MHGIIERRSTIMISICFEIRSSSLPIHDVPVHPRIEWRLGYDRLQSQLFLHTLTLLSYAIRRLCIYIPPISTLSVIILAAPILTPSCTQFGSARIRLLLPAISGTKTCAPRQLKTCFTIASATSDGSMTTAPRFFSSAATGARSGVRTQLGWMEVVSTLGAL